MVDLHMNMTKYYDSYTLRQLVSLLFRKLLTSHLKNDQSFGVTRTYNLF